MNQVEYLPLCDLLFNIISLLSYFSDVVFDLLTCYTLYVEGRYGWFGFTLGCIAASTVACQVMSVRWHASERRLDDQSTTRWDIVVVHALQCGVLWRYFRLFMPVDLRRVKRAVRDLCILRLIHFGGAAGPMLLVHFYLGWTSSELTRLHVVSTCLCMFSVCWALASFSKHIRQQNLHRLVLTWLGVIYQFLWRLGTVSSRVAALTLYATAYDFWVLLVVALHWLSMCLWLASNFPFRGEKLTRTRKCALSLLVTYVYVYCYLHVDLQESNARHKMATFYVTVFFENTLLLALWWHGQRPAETPAWQRSAAILLVWGGFVFGIIFMLLYYRYFHVTRLKHGLMPLDYNGWPTSAPQSCCALCRLGTATCSDHYDQCSPGAECVSEYAAAAASSNHHLHQHHHHQLQQHQSSKGALPHSQFTNQHRHNHHHHHHHHHRAAASQLEAAGGVAYIHLPGVFNCRLNPAFKRKKKKPTTFIPVPFQALATVQSNGNGKAAVPFWKKQPQLQQQQQQEQPQQPRQQMPVDHQLPPELPSPEAVGLLTAKANFGSSASAVAAASRVNIQQKLMEKRQKQLQELRVIEEEIKQGKFQRPHPSDLSEQGTLRQPIPRLKKQPIQAGQPMTPLLRKSRLDETEILLTPHCLDNNNSTMVYYDYWEEKWRFAPPSLRQQQQQQQCPVAQQQYEWRQWNGGIPSDLDSQASLPRSFTLPREFRYNRKPKARRAVRSERFVTSTNSSDGDVDSCDENDQPADATTTTIAYRHLTNPASHPQSGAETTNAGLGLHHHHHPGLSRPGQNRHETQL